MDHAKTIWEQAEIPLRHQKHIEDSDAPKAWVTLRDKTIAMIGSGFGVALVGKRGTGKTQIAVQAALANMLGNRRSRYAKAMMIFLHIRAAMKSETGTELEAINSFVEPDLLVIDEIQVRGETDFEDRMLVHIFDMRYDAMKDTILIANLTETEFKESVGSSITDRLREIGGVVKCDWDSFRA